MDYADKLDMMDDDCDIQGFPIEEDGDYKPGCPMSYNVPPDMANKRTYDCMEEKCAWWCEEAQKCALLVIAEAQRKAVKR